MFTHGHLIPGKLEPPPVASRPVDRSRVFSACSIVPEHTLTLVEAPAGYGKTTLLAQWYFALRAGGVRTGWLSLDAQDNEPEQFTRYLLNAAARGGVPFGELTRGVGEGFSDMPVRAGLAVLLSRLASFGRPFVLFMDDLHKVDAPECADLLNTLLERAAENVYFVIATRARPAHCQLAKLGVLNRLRLIGIDDLRFTSEEGASFLGEAFSAEDAHFLISRTEGWPVALHLLRTSRALSGTSDPLPNPGQFQDLSAYLAEQVLSGLSAEDQEFLMMTSLPLRLNGDLANRLCDRNDGWEMLERMERCNLLLVPLDSSQSWYRYHDLFRDFLNTRLWRLRGEDAVRRMHRRAAEWFAEHRLLPDALSHSVEGRDHTLTLELLEKAGGWRVGLRGGMSLLRRLSVIPQETIRRFPSARLAWVYHLMQASQVRGARTEFEALRADTADFTSWNGEALPPHVRMDCQALECGLLLYEDIPIEPAFVDGMRADLERLDPDDPLLRVLIDKNFALFAYYDAGRYEECIRVGKSAAAGFHRHEALYALNYVYFYIGLSHFHRGELDQALEYYRMANEFASRYFPDDFHTLIAKILIGQVHWQRNELEQARRDVNSALSRLPRDMDGWVPCFEAAYTTAARLRGLAGDADGALEILDEGRDFAQAQSLNRLRARLEIQTLEELDRAGRHRQAARQAVDPSVQAALCEAGGPCASPRNRIEATIAVARHELLAGAAASARERLQPLVTGAGEHAQARLRARLLAAAADLAGGHDTGCATDLREVVHAARRAGLIRCVLDERPVLESAGRALRATGEPREAHALERLLAHFEHGAGVEEDETHEDDVAAAGALAGQRLSPRERDVLDLLSDGLSGKEIALQLGLSESTVKSYRKTLYQKLGAGRRSQAIANARRMALIA